MSSVIDINDLCRPSADVETALQTEGYVDVFRSERSRTPAPAIFVNASGEQAELQSIHGQTANIDSLKCYFVRDVSIAGHGFMFRDGSLVTHGNDPHGVAESFARKDGFLDGSLATKDERWVDGPLLNVCGPGHAIWGHWLLDFLPRIAIAQNLLGSDLSKCKIPLPTDTPAWVFRMIGFYCGIDISSIVLFDRATEAIRTREPVCTPNFAHTQYFLHSFIKKFYDRFRNDAPLAEPGKICVSRKLFAERWSIARSFPKRSFFEQTATRFGYKIVNPETMTFRQQIDLFASCSNVVGEFGSGLHNAIFSPPGTIVGQFAFLNATQSRISALCDHRSVYLLPDNSPRFDAPIAQAMEISEDAIVEFFQCMQAEFEHKPRPLSKSSSENLINNFGEHRGPFYIPSVTKNALPSLIELASRYGSDKYNVHDYIRHYEHHLGSMRHQPVRLLEIGIGGYDDPQAGGASLRMWRDYFQSGSIVGIDFYDKTLSDFDRIETYRGHQADVNLLRSVSDRGDGFDIVIDDGSHVCTDVITSFCELFPLMRDGGLYVIESIQTSYWKKVFGGSSEEMNSPLTSMGFLKNLADALNHAEFERPGYTPTYIDKHVISIAFYHNIVFVTKGTNANSSNVVLNNRLPPGLSSFE